MDNIKKACLEMFRNNTSGWIDFPGPFIADGQMTLRLAMSQFEDIFFESNENKPITIVLICINEKKELGCFVLYPEISGLVNASEIGEAFEYLNTCPYTLASFTVVQAKSSVNKIHTKDFDDLEKIEFQDSLYIFGMQKDIRLYRCTPYKLGENNKFIRTGVTECRDSNDHDMPSILLVNQMQ